LKFYNAPRCFGACNFAKDPAKNSWVPMIIVVTQMKKPRLSVTKLTHVITYSFETPMYPSEHENNDEH
jgi:hypothetical protein